LRQSPRTRFISLFFPPLLFFLFSLPLFLFFLHYISFFFSFPFFSSLLLSGTSICIVDETGRIVKEVKSEFFEHDPFFFFPPPPPLTASRDGLKKGRCSKWTVSAIDEAELPVDLWFYPPSFSFFFSLPPTPSPLLPFRARQAQLRGLRGGTVQSGAVKTRAVDPATFFPLPLPLSEPSPPFFSFCATSPQGRNGWQREVRGKHPGACREYPRLGFFFSPFFS